GRGRARATARCSRGCRRCLQRLILVPTCLNPTPLTNCAPNRAFVPLNKCSSRSSRAFPGPGQRESDFRAGAGVAFDGAFAAEFGQALAHVPEAVGPGILRRAFEAAAVVLDGDAQIAV